MATELNLDPGPRDRINAILDGCFWDSFFVDAQTLIGVLVLELVGIAFEQQRPGYAYPTAMVCYPVTRVAASYQVDGVARPIELEHVNDALREFNSNEIDDWDIIDPPFDRRFRWQENVSFDLRLGANEGRHVVEVWQDENPFQALDLAMWFDKLFLFNAKLDPISLADLERARSARTRRISNEDLGWRRVNSFPALSPEELLERIETD